MRTVLNLTLFIYCIFLPAYSEADVIQQCGIYEMEGHIVVKNKIKEFVINRFSHSEIRVKIDTKDILDEYSNEPVRVQIGILRQCQFECHGDFIKVISRLDPFAIPKNPFYPKPEPTIKKPCLN